MNKCIAVTVALASVPILAVGQIVIGEDSMPPNASEYLNLSDRAESRCIDLGSTGGGQEWAILAIGFDTLGTTHLFEAFLTAYADTFPAATHALVDEVGGDDADFLYLRLEEDGLFMLGAVNTDGDESETIRMQPEALYMPLPLTAPASWTTVIRFTHQPEPGVTVTVTDSTLNTVNSWGTLHIREDSWPALLVRGYSFNTTEYPPFPPETEEHAEYSFLTEAIFQGAFVEPTEEHGDVIVGQLEFTLLRGTEASETRGPSAQTFRLQQNYPNPFNPTTTLPIELDVNASIEVRVYDELGRMVSERGYTLGPGTHEIPFDGSAWASGTYFADVRSKGQRLSRRMQLLR